MSQKSKKILIVSIALIAVIAAIVTAVILLNNSNNHSDPYDRVNYDIDSEDLASFNSEKTNRMCITADYGKRADLFMGKAMAADDRDGDGYSTLQNCIDSLKKECPSDMTLPEFLLNYLQKKFDYVSDEEQFRTLDWATYPTEMLSSKKGDCEDFSILSVGILYRAGYDCGIAVFKDHAVALVAGTYDISKDVPGYTPITVEHDGRTYYVLDASFDGPMGYTVDSYTSADIKAIRYASM